MTCGSVGVINNPLIPAYDNIVIQHKIPVRCKPLDFENITVLQLVIAIFAQGILGILIFSPSISSIWRSS